MEKRIHNQMTKNLYFNGCERGKTSSLSVTGIKTVGIGTLIRTIYIVIVHGIRAIALKYKIIMCTRHLL